MRGIYLTEHEPTPKARNIYGPIPNTNFKYLHGLAPPAPARTLPDRSQRGRIRFSLLPLLEYEPKGWVPLLNRPLKPPAGQVPGDRPLFMGVDNPDTPRSGIFSMRKKSKTMNAGLGDVGKLKLDV